MKASRGKSIFRAPLMGALSGALLTIAAIKLAFIQSEQTRAFSMLFILVGLPAHFLCAPFGYDPLTNNNPNADFINLVLVPIIFNTLLFSLFFFTAGKIAGYIWSKFEKTSGE